MFPRALRVTGRENTNLGAEDDVLDADEVAMVKVCPRKDVVVPEAARVMAGPPTDVTSTTGAPFAAAGQDQFWLYGCGQMMDSSY